MSSQNEKTAVRRGRAEQYLASASLSGQAPSPVAERLIEQLSGEGKTDEESLDKIRRAFGLPQE